MESKDETQFVTRHLFIDTSSVEETNFQFDTTPLRKIGELARDDLIYFHTTDITVSEIRDRLQKCSADAIEAIKVFRKKARILRNLKESPFVDMFSEFNAIEATTRLNMKLEEFLALSKANFIPVDKVSIPRIFEKYFDRRPPFGTGKKKCEFPDAFVIAALENWCSKSGNRIYVISSDPDFKEACEASSNLILLQKMDEFLEIYNRHKEEKLVKTMYYLFNSNLAWMEAVLSDIFADSDFIIAEDWASDVENIKVSIIEIVEINLLEFEERNAKFGLDLAITFSADYSAAVWDNEDKEYVKVGWIEELGEFGIELSATIDLEFNESLTELTEIRDVEINNGLPIELSLSDDEQLHKLGPKWPYK